MGFWERLVGSEQPQHKDQRLLLPELLANYQAEIQLTKQIQVHAELSPHQAGADQLCTAAEQQDRIATLLQDKIVELGGGCQKGEATPKEGQNHWSRVVHDIEDSKVLTQKYNEQAIYWDPDVPDAAEFFFTLERAKQRLNALLRDIALRADPHALD